MDIYLWHKAVSKSTCLYTLTAWLRRNDLNAKQILMQFRELHVRELEKLLIDNIQIVNWLSN